MSQDPDDAIDALLRDALAVHDLPAGRIGPVRARAHDELRRAHDRGRRARRAVEAATALTLGAVQIAWAIAVFLDRPY